MRHGVGVEAMRIVYTSLIISIFEYGCVVLSPVSSQLGHIQGIQDRFLIVVGVKLGFDYHNVSLDYLAEALDLDLHTKRRQLLLNVTLHVPLSDPLW